ncbi:MAG: hypothetical protein F2590_03885 [Actinobacteria bacterium]|uniref:Unannotated protein n=1 Tax=freshwater metagenome TaxID=449393 RepID=A0A6J6HRA1_9ZZZZ|nr:hypothetical protein [Actinomycetota bacterium]
MRKRLIFAVVTLALVFVISVVGASVLNLAGSDSAPGEGKTDAACASNLVITHPVSNGGHDNNRILHVTVTGDMTECEGQAMRVEVDLPNAEHAFAVEKIGADVRSIEFLFNETTGDFTDTAPIAVDGELVAQGDLLGPIKAKDFGLVSLLIASSWE